MNVFSKKYQKNNSSLSSLRNILYLLCLFKIISFKAFLPSVNPQTIPSGTCITNITKPVTGDVTDVEVAEILPKLPTFYIVDKSFQLLQFFLDF